VAGIDVGRITRGVLINQATNEPRVFFFNPLSVTSNVTVNWDKHVSIGASYERLHYRNTSNATFNLELIVNRMVLAKRFRDKGKISREIFPIIRNEFDDYRKYLLSLCYPRGRPNDPIRRSPPRVLFLWPRFLAIEAVVSGQLSFVDEQFAQNAEPIHFRATLPLEEVRDFRLTSAQIRREGFRRPGGVRRGEQLLGPRGSKP
jgi:hypothetical protein